MKYKLVIFDFDGTLADSFPWFVTVLGGLSVQYGLPQVEPGAIEQLRRMEISQILKEYRVPFWKMVMIGKHLQRIMSSQIDQIPLVTGMDQVIDSLGQLGTRLAVVTSNAEHNVRRVLGPEKMAYFEHIESGVSMFGKKSKFQKVLRKTGVAAHETLTIGDELRDLRSARAANIAFGAVSWGYTDLLTLKQHNPEEVFSQPGQILDAVCGQS